MSKMEESKYVIAEWRISIYGKNKQEWDNLANWTIGQKV